MSLFIDPSRDQVKAAHKADADIVEIHTGPLANARTLEEEKAILENNIQMALQQNQIFPKKSMLEWLPWPS